MPVMCDTNVLVRAAITPGGAAGQLLSVIAREHILIVSTPLLAEVLEVMRRERVRLNDSQIQRFITRFYKLAAYVKLPTEFPILVGRDPKDNPIVMTAVVGKADVLFTRSAPFRSVGSEVL